MGTEYFAVGVHHPVHDRHEPAARAVHVPRCSRGKRTLLDPVFVPLERLVLRVTGVDPNEQQDWKRYSVSLLISNIVMWLATFAIVLAAEGAAAQS